MTPVAKGNAGSKGANQRSGSWAASAQRSALLLALVGSSALRGCLSFVPGACHREAFRGEGPVGRTEPRSVVRRRCPTSCGRTPPCPRGIGAGVALGAAGAFGDGERRDSAVGAEAGPGGEEGEGWVGGAEQQQQQKEEEEEEEVDVVVIGAGIGGLTCAALLAQYGLDVTVCESHTIPGGCAHSFERDGYKFDSGPSIFSGFTGPVPNPLKQVLNVLDEELPCIRYDGWGNLTPSGYFKFDLGPDSFRDDVLKRLGGPESARQFDTLLAECKPLMEAASALPSLSLRSDKWAAVTMLRFLPALLRVIPLADELNGPFRPKEPVTDSFLFNWLDLLAFSLSGLKAEGTSCAAMAYVLADLHREGAKLDYPVGGSGAIVEALVRGFKKHGGTLRLGTHVEQVLVEGEKAVGVRLRGKGGGSKGRRARTIRAKRAVVMNADRWAAAKLLPEGTIPEEKRQEAEDTPKTMSFMHLHLGIEGPLPPGTDPHYTVINRWNDTLGEQNMIAVSLPTLLDSSLAPPGHHIIHAYAAANEPYELWQGLDRRSPEYKALKEDRAKALWEAVERVVPDARKMAKTVLVGSPLTHERFNRRSYGTYGPAFEDGASAFPTPVDIPLENFYSCGDCVFPGVGVPAVAVSGANVANSCVGPLRHLRLVNRLQKDLKMLERESAG
uniref:Prolycopene isomerase-like2 n=1 Tax=Petalonia fascia TaxID=2893 RepID=A0A2D2AH35_PETFA|nr:prolycopene isomerase-like2 [Petalonia fascia]